LAVLALYGGASLFFITLIIPAQFERQWITIGWALEGMALCWLFHRIPHPGLRLVGVGLLTIAFIRLSINPAVLSYHPLADLPILNWYLYAYGLCSAAMFHAARLLAPPRDRLLNISAPSLLNALGTALVFLLVNIEIADFFSEPGSSTLTFQFSGSLGRDMTYTIAWALFALMLLAFGLVKQSRGARYAGVALMVLALLKLYFQDLANLNQLYRIGTLAVVAVIAIIASLLYQRFLMPSVRTTRSSQNPGRPDNARPDSPSPP
jgi:uncharacterized membrane protein